VAAVTVMIATPLPPELARRVADVDADVRLLYDPAVLPPSRWPGDVTGDPGFERDAAGNQRWSALLADADVLFGIPGNSGAGLVETLRDAPRVRWVQARNAGAGEQLGAALALEPGLLRDVTVTSVSGIHAGPLAEFALLGLLAFAKRLPELERDKARRNWPDVKPTMGVLAGRTVLVVGLGEIGVAVARLAGALGMRVLGVKRTPAEVPGVEEVAPPDRLADLARQADALVVTTPLTDGTRGLVDRATLAALRPGAVVVNVGRGPVIDEPALIDALRDGHLAGACLDVYAEEPLPPDSPLWTLENVILCPHVAARTDDEDERAVELFAANLRRRLDGAPLRNRVDPGTLY
jgi:phosphoglycerate dehydrogenase-like enzyme